MTGDDLDRMLSDEDPLLPSSGFTASVMEAVQREASAPPPLGFPWRHALPGLIALIVALTMAVWSGIGALNDPAAGALVDERVRALIAFGTRPDIAWTALAAVMTIVPALLSLRLIRRRV